MQAVLSNGRVVIVGFLLLLNVSAGGLWLIGAKGSAAGTGFLEVYFLDIGQGDAIFIITPEGGQILIDGGPNNTVLRQLRTAMPWWDRSIDVVVGTHFDKDHVGGLVDVLSRYRVGEALITINESGSVVKKTFKNRLVDNGIKTTYVQAGERYQLGEAVDLLVFSPTAAARVADTNTSSIVLQLRYQDTSFLLTGDAPSEIEDYLVRRFGDQLQSQVLKLGHHGSRTSSSALFLAAVAPEYAIVSAGRNNSYGHPHPEVLERAVAAEIKILSTTEQGTIHLVSDGQTVMVK